MVAAGGLEGLVSGRRALAPAGRLLRPMAVPGTPPLPGAGSWGEQRAVGCMGRCCAARLGH